MKGKNGKKGVEPVVQLEFAPPRDPIEKPIKTPEEELEDLRRNMVEKEDIYFPNEIKEKFKKIFDLFDEDEDGIIDYPQLHNCLMAVNSVYKDEKMIIALYDLLKSKPDDSGKEGIKHSDFLLILSKKKKDEDLKTDLLEAFKFLDQDGHGVIDSEKFFDMLVYNGYRYSEDMAEIFMKLADPKGTGKVLYDKFVEEVTKEKKGKGRGRKGKGKKK